MSQDPFDRQLREQLHDALDDAHPSSMLRRRTELKLGSGARRLPPPRTLLIVAAAVAALLLGIVGAGALTKGSEHKTRLATSPPAVTPTEVTEPAVSTTTPPTPRAAVGPPTTARRSTTTTRPTTTTISPPPTLPAYNPPQSAVSRGPSSDQGCAALVLTVATDHTYYLKGTPVLVTVMVSNPSNSPCNQACPPSFWLAAHIGNDTSSGLEGKGAFGCGGAIAAHGSYSVHYTWCQVMGQQSPPENTCPIAGQAPDAPSGRYVVESYTNFTTEGDQMAGPFTIYIE